MKHNFMGLIVLIMMFIIFLNETYNISKFLILYNTIKSSATINKDTCDDYYMEAETARYQLSKNSYNILLKNDIFNYKTYSYFILIVFIILYLYSLQYFINAIDNNNNNNIDEIIGLLIIVMTFIIILIFILLRYVPTDDAGYLNLFNSANAMTYFINIVIYLFIIMFVILIVYKLNVDKNMKINRYIILLYLLMSFYLFINYINIVMTFKKNEKIYDCTEKDVDCKKFTADISYDNENYYYYMYSGLKDYSLISYISAFSNYTGNNIKENNFSYNINAMFIRNIKQFFLAFLIIIFFCIAIILYNYIKNDKLNEMVVDLIFPIIYVFILIFFITNCVELNTSINYHIIYKRNGYYKNDLLKINKYITPYIYILDKKNDDNSNTKERDYKRNYIILNVFISYLFNYIHLDDNLVDDVHKLDNNRYANIIFENNKKLDKINRNIINDGKKFDEYFSTIINNIDSKDISTYLNKLFKDNITYKGVNIPLDVLIKTLDDNEKEYYTELSINNEIENTIKNNATDILKNNIDILASSNKTNAEYAKSLLNSIRTSIKNNIYILFDKIENFNQEKINDDIAISTNDSYINNVTIFIYYKNDDDTKSAYKFLIHKNFFTDTTYDSAIIDNYSKDEKINNLINKLITKFFIIIKELLKQKHDENTSNNYKKNVFLNILNDKISNNETMIGNNTAIIYYLKNIVLEYECFFKSDNYLKKSIKNNYNKINNENYDIVYFNDNFINTFVDNKLNITTSINNDNEDFSNIIQNSFIVSHTTNIIMFYIIYVMINS